MKKIILTKQKEEHNNEEIQQIYIKYKEEKSIMTKMRSLSRKKTSVSTVTPSKSAAASNSITTETEHQK